ncbi:T-cell leukemia homeobox protein 3 [Sarcoptes scabiei]|nr:T-cell leukemia homeobox protein 3 [Sarcoptes scabiei]
MDYLFCLNRCFGIQSTSQLSHFERSFNEIILDGTNIGILRDFNLFKHFQIGYICIGDDVVLIKKGHRICGTGGAITNYPIVQNKAYFEAKIQQSGTFGIGLATKNVDLNSIPLGTDDQSWVLRQDGSIVHNNTILYQNPISIQEGDIVSITYDHIQLKFFLNNDPINYEVLNVKGSEIFPVPPPSFDAILIEKALL